MTPLLKTRDVAELLGLTDETILSYASKGILPGFRLPHGALRFRQEDVERWLEAHAVGAVEPSLHAIDGGSSDATAS